MACLWIPSGCIKNVNLGGKQLNYYACLFAATVYLLYRVNTCGVVVIWLRCHCAPVCINGLVLFSIPNFNVYISAHAQMYIFAHVPKIRGPTVGEHRISLRLDQRTRTGNVYWAIRDFTGCQPQVLTETSWFFMGISWCDLLTFPAAKKPALRRWGDDKKYIIKTMSSRDLNALKGVIDAHPEEGMWGWFPTLPHKKEHVWTNVVNPCEDKTCAGIPMFPFIIYIYCSRLWCTADISSLKPWSKRRPQRDLWWTRLKCQGQKWSEHLRDSKHDDIDFPWETCSSSS